jgi:type IV pilus assembly protein PilY1
MKNSFVCLVTVLACTQALSTDISPVPLSTIGISGVVKPNIMVMLDNSGSMDWDFVGDYVNDGFCKVSTTGGFTGYCCNDNDSSSNGSGNSACWTGNTSSSWTRRGHPPFLNADFNGMAYNPAVQYEPPKKANSPNWSSIGSPWTSVKNDAYGIQNTGSINLLTGFPDTQWCSDISLTNCIRNGNYLLPGIIAGTEYKYFKATTGNGTGSVAIGPPTSPTLSTSRSFGPHYYGIVPGEYCTSIHQDVCHIQSSPDATYRVAAKVRWCSNTNLSTCQATKTNAFQYPRYPGRTVVATATVTVIVSNLSVTNITVNGSRIMNAATSSKGSTSQNALKIATAINGCTISMSGQCQVAGYSAKALGAAVTISGPLNGLSLTATPVVTPGAFTTVVAFDGAAGSTPGSFVRIDIVPSINSYSDPASVTNVKHPDRTDCVGTTCTYIEEMTNFANWWTYYHTRMQTMKSALGTAFSDIAGGYNMGFSLLSDVGYSGVVTSSSHGMYPALFTGQNRTNWYAKLVAANPANSTPLRSALDEIGKMYANISPYNFSGSNRVVQYACQQNFAMVTTDGYWNQSYNGSVNNNDTTADAARFCTRAGACVDPSTAAENASLADVALYWYNGGSNSSTVSLRPDLDTAMNLAGKVPFTSADPNTHLHMTTYTLGLGVSGNVAYEKNYDTSPLADGDFAKIINNTMNWPQAIADSSSAVDDLWHSAVNGHGKYFSARSPEEVVSGLRDALANMKIRTGASAASATSTPNISQTDNDIFSSTFTTGKWFGEVYSQKIDSATGATLSDKTWNSSITVGQKVNSNTDTRTIYMSSGAGQRKNFIYSEMNANEKAWFDNKGATMQQYGVLTASDKAIANSGNNLVNWMRGQYQFANDDIFRSYLLYGSTLDTPNLIFDATANPYIVLGDVVTAKPAYVRKSVKAYTFDSYGTFRSSNEARPGMVYVAANDGMLHAFNSVDGVERWAYAPRITMPKLYLQANAGYGANHQYTVDGTPETADVQIGGAWKTILVGGLNAGGRGYYALDITDPANPTPLWEFCSDSNICAQNDADLGLTFGNPQIGMWNNQWVVLVTSGYNNTPGASYASSGGDGKGYLYILKASDGTLLDKVGTNLGSTSTPSGLGKILAITNNPQIDPVITYVFGGDVLGNMWRFDLTTPTTSTIPLVRLAELGSSRPITTKPDAQLCAVNSGTQRVLVWGTGRLLGETDVSDTSTQSFYAIKDTGTVLGQLSNSSSMVQQTWTNASTATTGVHTNLGVNWATKNGWYIDFSRNLGERVNIDPKIAYGTVYLSTNIPTSTGDSCSVGGSSNFNNYSVCGSVTDSGDTTGSVLTSSTSAIVGFTVIRLQDGKLIAKIKFASGSNTDLELNSKSSPAARKSGWRSIKTN